VSLAVWQALEAVGQSLTIGFSPFKKVQINLEQVIMKIISPLQFKNAFEGVVAYREPDILRCWSSGALITGLVRTTLLPEVAGRLGLEVYSEKDYYWLDAIFYEEKDTIHFGPEKTYAKYVAVALEHENIPTDTAIEMNKLQLFNAPLKVLITYAGGSNAERLLEKYARIMAGADVFSDFTTERKQLVIFGPPGSRPPARLHWTFHVYENGAFVTL